MPPPLEQSELLAQLQDMYEHGRDASLTPSDLARLARDVGHASGLRVPATPVQQREFVSTWYSSAVRKEVGSAQAHRHSDGGRHSIGSASSQSPGRPRTAPQPSPLGMPSPLGGGGGFGGGGGGFER